MLDDGRVNRDALICARYWRNSLADAGLGRGAFRNDDVAAFIPVDSSFLLQGRVDEEAVAALFRGSDAEAQSLTVLLRPFVYRARTEHGRRFSTLPDGVAAERLEQIARHNSFRGYGKLAVLKQGHLANNGC
jgi:hypothetical protein